MAAARVPQEAPAREAPGQGAAVAAAAVPELIAARAREAAVREGAQGAAAAAAAAVAAAVAALGLVVARERAPGVEQGQAAKAAVEDLVEAQEARGDDDSVVGDSVASQLPGPPR